MSQTASTDVALVRGNLVEQSDDRAVIALPGTDYQLHLVISAPLTPASTGRIAGRVHARARRVDLAQGGRGGRFIEPVYGRPRRVQGRIVAVHSAANTITVLAACPIECELTSPGQRAQLFQVGDFVTFDVEPGAAFTQASE